MFRKHKESSQDNISLDMEVNENPTKKKEAILLDVRTLHIIEKCVKKVEEKIQSRGFLDAGGDVFFNTRQELINFIKIVGTPDTIPDGYSISVEGDNTKRLRKTFEKYYLEIEKIYSRTITFTISHRIGNSNTTTSRHFCYYSCDECEVETNIDFVHITFHSLIHKQIDKLQNKIDDLQSEIGNLKSKLV